MGAIYIIERRSGSGSFQLVDEVTGSLGYLDTGLSAGTTYTYRIKARNYGGGSDYSVTSMATTSAAVGDSSPVGIRLWLRADGGTSGPGSVSRWADQSGLGNDAFQVNKGEQPQLVANAINGYPVVRFNGGSNRMLLPRILDAATEGEVLAVVKANSAGGYHQLWQFGGTNGGTLYIPNYIEDDFGSSIPWFTGTPATPLTHYLLYNVSAKSGEWVQRFNGWVNFASTTNIVGFASSFVLGSRDAYTDYFDGDMAEVIVYDHVLSPAEREAVHYYLNQKYGFSGDGFTGIRDFESDADGDVISNADELVRGTNPSNADTDGDGIPDGWEIAHNLNPLVNDAAGDPDGTTCPIWLNTWQERIPSDPKAKIPPPALDLKFIFPFTDEPSGLI